MEFEKIIDKFSSSQPKFKKLHVYDWDGTLFKSPMPNPHLWDRDLTGYLANEHWYSNIKTLSPPQVPLHPDDSWFDEKMLSLARQSLKDGALTVMMTGRRLSQGFGQRIQEIMDGIGLEFHMCFYREENCELWENTIGYKTTVLSRLLQVFCEKVVEEVKIYDDRRSQINGFQSHLDKVRADWRKLAKEKRWMPEIKSVECIEWHQDPRQVKCMAPELETAMVIDTMQKVTRENPEIGIRKYCSFTGILLDDESKKRLLDTFWPKDRLEVGKWSLQNDHVTLFLGEATSEETKKIVQDLGGWNSVISLLVDKVSPPTVPLLAVTVCHLDGTPLITTNQHAHITIATASGVQPKESNNIQDWIPLQDKITIRGKVGQRWKYSLVKPAKPVKIEEPLAVSLGDLVIKYTGQPPGPFVGRAIYQIKAWMEKEGLKNVPQNAERIEAMSKAWCLWIQTLSDYIQAYNDQNLDKILDTLHEDCQVYFQGNLAGQGKSVIAPTYVKDWENDQTKSSKITIVDGPNYQDGGVFVKLNQPWLNRKVNVIYYFQDETTPKMIKHSILEIQ